MTTEQIDYLKKRNKALSENAELKKAVKKDLEKKLLRLKKEELIAKTKKQIRQLYYDIKNQTEEVTLNTFRITKYEK